MIPFKAKFTAYWESFKDWAAEKLRVGRKVSGYVLTWLFGIFIGWVLFASGIVNRETCLTHLERTWPWAGRQFASFGPETSPMLKRTEEPAKIVMPDFDKDVKIARMEAAAKENDTRSTPTPSKAAPSKSFDEKLNKSPWKSAGDGNWYCVQDGILKAYRPSPTRGTDGVWEEVRRINADDLALLR